ncbi:MAG: hypothetical protein LUE22_07035 [Oscillospiraceae bacterium]|nr:hypothetical protein [Oscillospiraceae bacterium]
MITALWRMGFSHRHMLQWIPAAQSEGLKKWPAAMWFSVAGGLALMLLAPGPAGKASGVVWLCAPLFAYLTGQPQKPQNDLTEADRAFLQNSAQAIWGYFAQYCNRENHWLPPDNVQVQPPKGAARRTSPTNIGMALASALAAAELGLAPETEAMALIERIMSTIERLPKWRGHLYNWYDTGTCAPLQPAYVSTVDSGNLCASLVCLSHGLKAHGRPDLAERAGTLAANMELGALYDEKRRLFRIGIDPASETVSPSHYDLMASEARLTSYLACARGEVPLRHWQALSRVRLSLDGWRGLASWSGSMFEYLMPELFLPLVNGSMLWETGRFCLYAQRRRGARADAPWGNSESAFFSLDAGMDYRYKAHGTGALALRRDMDGELVIAPYASFLALCVHPKAAVKNLRRLKRMGMYGEFGFYEALDMTPGRTGKKGEPVACFMSHHLGMSLCAAANCLAGGVMRKYFMAEPACAAFRPLLAERVPLGGAVLRRDRSPVTRPPESRQERPVFTWEGRGADPNAPAWMPLSNGVYSLRVCDDGQCLAQTAGLLMYRPEGLALSVDGVPLNPSRQAAVFRPWRYEAGAVTFTARQGDKIMSTTIAAASGECGELRRVTGPTGGRLEIRFEPVLARESDYAAHPAFWRLGLEVLGRSGSVLVRRLARGSLPEVWLCMTGTMELKIAKGAGWQMTDPVILRATLPEGGCGALALCFGRSREEAMAGARRILAGGGADMAASMAALLGMGADGIGAAFALCGSICAPRVRADEDCTREALWKQGLSGDLPILYVRADKELDEARRMIKRHALLAACGVKADLVIDTGEEGAYLRPNMEALRRYLEKYGLAGFEGVKGGVHFTGDQALCQRKAPWLEGTALRPEESDRYFTPALTGTEGTVLEHAVRAMDCVLGRGAGPHGLLFTGSGDWNDGMDKVGGESVWLTWFFVHTAGRMAALMKKQGRKDSEPYAQAVAKYAQAAEHAWDGSWYLRGWWQDGAPLGAVGSPACAIDSIAQSWAAFCPQAERGRVRTALMSCVERLYDPAHGITRLFAPPFGDEGRDPGYIRACGPGFRENGGQYTHGALWLASALLREGFTEEGSAILLNAMPTRHPAAQWQAEPYVLAADVSANADHYAQANWSWYTGAAGWFFRVVLEDLLGIHLNNGRLTVSPRLPAGWEGYEADVCGRHIKVWCGKVTIT